MTDALATGRQLLARGAAADALPLLERAVRERPREPVAHFALGVARVSLDRPAAAAEAFQRCVALSPKDAEGWNNLGSALRTTMRVPEALVAYRAAIAARPEKENAWRNLLYTMHYDPAVTRDALLAAHQDYGRRFAVGGATAPEIAAPDPARPLHVGYVSPDFGRHPVGFFLLPVLANHDRRAFRVTAYAGPRRPDDVTARLRASVDAWVETGKLDDQALADRVRADRVDVLVDLAGHTRQSRLAVFGRRPAPVQVTWAGYVGTTGLTTMDWLIGDARHTPAGDERYTVERIWRMPETYVVWEPPDDPEPGPLPMLTRGAPLFGCFNNLTKLHDGVVARWSSILRALPGARLRLVTRALFEPSVRALVAARFAAHGVETERLELAGAVPRDELLRMYREEIDVALDPAPYSGGLTTLEALWSGVPVVTLGGGDRFSARHSEGHLGAMGLSDWVARDAADYEAKVLERVRDQADLARLRAELRPRMRASPLVDGPRFTRALEDAFRAMWRERVAGLAG